MNDHENQIFLDYLTEGINVSNDYSLIFNRNLELVSFSKATIKILQDESLANYILGKDIFFHIPEFQEIWHIEDYISDSSAADIPLNDNYLIKSQVVKESVYTSLRMYLRHDYIILSATDISDLKKITEQNQQLKNTIGVLTRLLEEKQDEIEKNCYYNLEEVFFPMLDLLKFTEHNNEQNKEIINLLKSNIESICEPFVRLSIEQLHLTQKEIEIANLIRLGKTSKEIANLLNISCKTVDFHRANIRKRLCINNANDDLRTCLIDLNKKFRNGEIFKYKRDN